MTDLKSNNKQSIEFLARWSLDGPWTLTAIHPDKNSIETRTFSELGSDIERWVTSKNAKHNIYFNVNPTLYPMDKKAEKTDVAALSWLHVDVDPRPGRELDAEQERALRILESPLEGVPNPTCIIFSGGGYQAFWRLEEPLEVNGDKEKIDEAERWNLQLALIFSGDHCHNIDRIMRLPGTVNWPNEKKRKKGRVPAMAYVHEFNENSYSLSVFTPAAMVQSSDDGFAQPVEVSGNLKRLDSLDELPAGVKDSVKAVINQGKDLDNPDKFPSRSECLFWVCCEMVRAGCDDDLIFSVITDPDFKISESVLNKGSLSDKYACRQIQRAREEAIHPKLRELNEKHAVISDLSGKCRIISEVEETIGGRKRAKITYMSFSDFNNRYMNQRIDYVTSQGNPTSVQLGKWWMHHPNRSQFDAIIFEPGHEVPGSYNLWKGFAFDARPGGSCELFLNHVRENICGGSEDHYNYVLGWMATAVQKPDNPGHTAIVLRGKRGTGKSFFVKTFGRLFGRHFMHVSDSKHLVGSFNAHLQDCVVLFADEAFYAGDKKHEGVLKMLITEETFTVEKKGVDATLASNYVHLLMASNDEWIVPAGFDERRFLVLDVSDASIQDTKYFGALDKELKDGGYEALLHYLMSHSLEDYNVRNIPSTKALQDQKILSFNNEQEWWFSKLVSGEIFEGAGWPGHVFTSHLVYDFTRYMRLWNMSSRGNSTRLGRFLRVCFPKDHKLRAQLGSSHDVVTESGEIKRIDRPRVYVIPTLDECRKHWDENFGGPYEWTPMTTMVMKTETEKTVF